MAQTGCSSKTLANGIHALVGGSGATIICLPGWPQTAEAFAEVFPLLSKNHQVIVLDPPGLGDSAPSTNSYDTKAISNTLAAAAHSELGPSRKYHLVSHDVGAWIAYAWASQHPPSVLSLMIIDSAVPGLAAPLSYPLPDAANVKLWQFSFNRLPDLPEILTQGRERELLNWLFDNKSAHPERITPPKRDHYVACYSKPGAMSIGFAYYRAVPESTRQNREEFGTRKLGVPVLAIGGEIAAGESMRGIIDIAEKSDLSRFVVVRDCGHYVMEEQPEATAKEILEFIADVERAA